jgi:hypothetical protein
LKIKLILSFTRVSANNIKVRMELFDEIVVWIILNILSCSFWNILSFTRVSANNKKKVRMELFDEIVVWIILNILSCSFWIVIYLVLNM